MPRRVGAYAKLLANYASDDAIIAAGEAAELLFVRSLAFCATSDSDGYITDGQLARIVAAGMKDLTRRAAALVREGLWERAEDGYQVRSWTKIHESAEEKGRARRTDRERKRRGREPDSERIPSGHEAESDTDSERIPQGVTADSLLCSYLTTEGDTEQSNQSQDTASDTTRRAVARFGEFWEVFPKRVAKAAAQRRWKTVVSSGVDPEAIIGGAKRYADQVRGTDPAFIKQPDGWLLAGRWEDEELATTRQPATPWNGLA